MENNNTYKEFLHDKKYDSMLERKKEAEELYSSACKNVYEYERNILSNTIIPFGKYKGRTVESINEEDQKYLYWLLSETNFNLDPRLLGFTLPNKENILKCLGYNFKFEDGYFIQTNHIFHDAVYREDWYGHHPKELVREAYSETQTIKYDFDEIISIFKQSLDEKYPFIKWTKEYLETFFK